MTEITIAPYIENEINRLKTVVLGIADSSGPTPKLEDAYDPKSMEHLKAGTYPKEEDLIKEMNEIAKTLEKHGVEVLRPRVLENCNQIFARDIAFVIEDKFIKSNILPDREEEFDGIQYILEKMDTSSIIQLPEEVHVEGGDVMPWHDYIFIGTYTADDYPNYITARTNKAAVTHIAKLFPNKTVKAFELRKSNTVANENALHLDCCFQPLGKGKAIIHKNGFLVESEYQWLVNFFGKENVFEITKEEMENMHSNIVSISPEIVVSGATFTRLNTWLREQGFTVEEVQCSEIAKQGGLLRCMTLPLVRER